jgi:putative transcriptional regulator
MENARQISGSVEGQLLIAVPHMEDPRFRHSVIFMCSHSRSGAVGLVVNKVIDDMPFADLLQQLDIERGEKAKAIRVHFGGPVEPGRGFVLHSEDWGGQDTISVVGPNGNYALTGTIDVLKAIAEGGGPSRWLIALGYAGWDGGQLEEEMTRHGWYSAAGSPAILFDTPADERWETAFQAEGIDPRLLATETGAA